MPHTDVVEMKIWLVAQGPLLLGGGLPIGNVRLSEQFVAGSVWRGAVAHHILERLGKRTYSGRPVADSPLPTAFTTVFGGQSPARFGFLYPLVGDRQRTQDWSTTPIPLTARTCKRYPGFLHKPEEAHGVYDGLLNQLEHVTRPTAARPGLSKCPECDPKESSGRLERIRGFASTPPTMSAYYQEKLGTRSLVRVGLNRYTETAQDQVLYVQDVLEPGHEPNGTPKQLSFVGHWRGTADQAELFQRLLSDHLLPTEAGGFQLRIGTARARGLGAVHLHISPPQALGETRQPAAVATRLAQFQPQQTGGGLNQAEHLYAALTLRTPVQLLDEQGAPTTQITEQLLQDYQPTTPAHLKILHACSVLEQEISSGWSAAWGLPKPVGPALAAGSVVVLRAPQQERQSFLDFLVAIEQNGLGERRAEGWGELLACDYFHVAYDERKAMIKGDGQ